MVPMLHSEKIYHPTAKELIVFPKPENFTMANPIPMPKIIDMENPMISLYMVTAMLVYQSHILN